MFHFTKKDLLRHFDYNYHNKSVEQIQLEIYILENCKDVSKTRKIMDQLQSHIRKGSRIGPIMNVYHENEFFVEEQELDKLTNLTMACYNGTNQWLLLGYSPLEVKETYNNSNSSEHIDDSIMEIMNENLVTDDELIHYSEKDIKDQKQKITRNLLTLAFKLPYQNPSLEDLVEQLYTQDDKGLYMDEKPNDIVGALVILLLIHNSDYSPKNEEHLLRYLRCWSRKVDVISLAFFYDDLIFNLLEEKDILDEIESFLKKHATVKLHSKIPSKPFAKIKQLQTKMEYDEYKNNMVDHLASRYYMEYGDSCKKEIIYHLLELSPFSYTILSMMLSMFPKSDHIPILKACINGFEIIHREELRLPTKKDFYKHEDNHYYILALDSLGYIYKTENKPLKALKTYEKALRYDKEDYMDIKEAMLVLYLTTGNIEQFDTTLHSLYDESIYKKYLTLLYTILDDYSAYQQYLEARSASSKIMDILTSKEELDIPVNKQEFHFLQDFYHLFRDDKHVIDTLRRFHNSHE